MQRRTQSAPESSHKDKASDGGGRLPIGQPRRRAGLFFCFPNPA
ncbi:hypothetical protein LG3211_1216 [Lysobacter gummosus]|nr:hypothetical protein LG3211_1216 [Lysobacter gummosus]